MADIATTPRKDGKPRLGGNKLAAEARRLDFVRIYLANGRNGQQAAIDVGISNETRAASHWASRVLRRADVRALITKELGRVGRLSGLTLERTLVETARVAYSDPRYFFRDDNSLVPIHQWDDDMAASVASIETGETVERVKPNGEIVRTISPTKLKFWDKNAALDKAMRHLGAFERDNAQRSENLALQVVLVGAPVK